MPRVRSLRILCEICDRQTMIPSPLAIVASYDRTAVPPVHGGFAHVWKGRSHDLDVAIKVLKIYQCSDCEQLGRVRFRLCFVPIASFGELTVMRVEVLQGSRDVVGTSSSKCFIVSGSDDDR